MKRIFLFIAFIIFELLVNAQDYKNKIDVIPPSPNAASLGSYGGLTPSLITGAAAVNIPVYSLPAGGHEVG